MAVTMSGGLELSGTSNVLTNQLLSKTTFYTVTNADKGKTIALGGGAFYNLTFPSASLLDADFQCVIFNAETSMIGKGIIGLGGDDHGRRHGGIGEGVVAAGDAARHLHVDQAVAQAVAAHELADMKA